MIVIGSTAIKHYFPDFNREPKDVDIIRRNVLVENDIICFENKKVEILDNPVIEDLYKNKSEVYISSNDLLTLKASHICWDINWTKHMWDIQFLLKKGCKIDYKLFKKLYEYWNTYHSNNKRSDLKMSKKEFFNNAINYDEMEHDEKHKLLNPIPIYTKVLRDNCEVELDENKFFNLSYEDKLGFVYEEVMVMAFERFKHLNYRQAYEIMLKKFIISHAPFFSLTFIIENYIELLKPKFDYFKILKNER